MGRLPNCPGCDQPLQRLKFRLREPERRRSIKKSIRIKSLDHDIEIEDPLYCTAENILMPAAELIELEQVLFDEVE